MKLLFKQRMFSWFDSYDVYDEDSGALFTVKGKLDWGHRLEIYDRDGGYLGRVSEKVLTFLPRFQLFIGEEYIGQITKEFSLFTPVFTLDCQGWEVRGDLFGWDYSVTDSYGGLIASAAKQLFNWTDTYAIDVADPRDALLSLMIVLAIDAAKCSSN